MLRFAISGLICALGLIAPATGVEPPVPQVAAAYVEGFDADGGELPAGWAVDGDVRIDGKSAFKGAGALRLAKSEDRLTQRAVVTGPGFPVAPGPWEIKLATRTDVESMDNSYNCVAALDCLDADGKTIAGLTLTEQYGRNAWKPRVLRVEIPPGTAAGRFRFQINKQTPGEFAIDELSAAPLQVVAKDDRIKRLMFDTARLGNLLYPQDGREVTLTVWSSAPLPPEQCRASCVVTDYWGAEQCKPMPATLEAGDKANGLFTYSGTLDLSSVPLETGRYYELHAEIDRGRAEPFRNHTSLAILPEAPANAFKPEEIPFTSRNWDNRVEEYVRLTHRLGIRICGVWGGWKPEPPYRPTAPQIKLVKELGMGFLTTTPATVIERRGPDWEKYDEKALRQGIRNFITTYGDVRPMIINLGNEPHNKGDAVKPEVQAYRILYDEIKKVDPTITVVGTSVGTGIEDYFAAGFGRWCDAYDFHVYANASVIRRILDEKYPEMFKKYGHAKPIWSTEVGSNSQGLTRQVVAGELYKKFANFFAGGGTSVSWFGLLYPDPQGINADSFGSAHNVFDNRYKKYAPKLDAVAYYNAVNSILVKKPVADRVYDGDIRVFFLRDAQGKSLLIVYKDKGRTDVFLPLPGAGTIDMIRIDGSHGRLDAAGEGVTLTISEDPVLLLLDWGAGSLPEALGPPAIRLGAAPATIVRGQHVAVQVLRREGGGKVALTAPPFWRVREVDPGDGTLRFELAVPEGSAVREADCRATLIDGSGKPRGEIVYRPEVTGALTAEIVPVPASPPLGPGVKLMIHNNGALTQAIAWELSLQGEQSLEKGQFTDVRPTEVHFVDAPAGELALDAGKSGEVVVRLAGADATRVYQVRAAVRDESGRTRIEERPMGGFVTVPKAVSPPVLDGVLDEPIWKKTSVQRLDKADQFWAFKKKENPASWQGPQDLSADLRFAWDDQFLYVAAVVTDDIAGALKPDAELWEQDSLQFLFDPMRISARKGGKYDYGVGDTPRGPRAQCYLSADGSIVLGEAPDIKVSVKRGKTGTGDITYELAIPWKNLAPFRPAVGANLGMMLAVNEDDGHGRDSLMTWFGNINSKDVDKVGDLILAE